MANVSELRNDYNGLIARLNKGPIVLSQRSKPTAVLVSPEAWDEAANLIQALQEQLASERRLRLSNQRYTARLADPARGVAQDEYEQLLAAAGLTE